ncbi:MAG: PRD domain-containing protein [Lachnospiraceae bacterium]|jgi:beta-glucoside operon transcriptional antiterminator|nr:PRD domain-containing protein [Lachnospiraceae bacterium]
MRIFKILNNNVAVVMDENGQEKIVMGRGICYKKKPGDAILEEEIDKTFFLSAADISNKFQELIQDIPIEHMAVGEEIIAEAERRLDKKLNDTVYISLIDHVHTSIVRFLEGVTVKNVLLWDIRRFYKEEFKIGLWALELIQEKCKVMLPEDEAGFIALHLANAQMDQESMHNMYEITRIIQEVVNLVKYYFKIDFHEDDVYYFRFITHLKFFAQRLVEQKVYTEDDIEDLWAVIRGKYPKSFDCVERITKFIESKYKYHLSKEEQLYLTIHIERVVSKNRN